MAAVLHLRGDVMCAQPAEDENGNVLLWNGEVRVKNELSGTVKQRRCAYVPPLLSVPGLVRFRFSFCVSHPPRTTCSYHVIPITPRVLGNGPAVGGISLKLQAQA